MLNPLYIFIIIINITFINIIIFILILGDKCEGNSKFYLNINEKLGNYIFRLMSDIHFFLFPN